MGSASRHRGQVPPQAQALARWTVLRDCEWSVVGRRACRDERPDATSDARATLVSLMFTSRMDWPSFAPSGRE